MANMNRTIGERDEAKRLRSEMDEKQAHNRANEAAVVRAHKNADGPSFGVSQQPNPNLTAPKVTKPGGG